MSRLELVSVLLKWACGNAPGPEIAGYLQRSSRPQKSEEAFEVLKQGLQGREATLECVEQVKDGACHVMSD